MSKLEAALNEEHLKKTGREANLKDLSDAAKHLVELFHLLYKEGKKLKKKSSTNAALIALTNQSNA